MGPDELELSVEMAADFADTTSLMRAVARYYPDRAAFVDGGHCLSFGAWDRSADGLARFLESKGVSGGDVVGLVLPSCIDYAVCYQAAIRLGAITSGVNPRLGRNEVTSILERTKPAVLVLDPEAGPAAEIALAWARANRARANRANRTDLVFRGELAETYTGPSPRHLPDLVSGDPVAVVWTSGTTGMPKGAVFDHANLKAVSESMGVLSRPGDRRLSPLPFAHVGYMTRPWDELAHVITTVITPSPWRAAEALALISSERITVAQGVPTQWSLMLDHPDCATTDFSSLRLAGTGAATVSPALVARMRRQLGAPVVVRYTSTEAALTTGTAIGDSDEQVANTVGRAAENVEIKLVDPSGNEVGQGEVGTLHCRSGAVMRCYWSDPQRSAAVLDKDGWLTSGDLGYLDPAGYLHLVGRRSEMYIRGGYNVYPAEVENVMAGHPGVARAAVVGRPDPILGEVGVAFVVAPPGAKAPSLGQIQQWCRDRLADYKAPDRLVVMGELPLTSMLKVDKVALVGQLDRLDQAVANKEKV
ncbi:MAG: class I adenylate-forming enzyme family protein [Acidimicrobiales bacterium]